MKTHWKGNSPAYTLISGKVPVGTAGYNVLRSRTDKEDNAYSWRLILPGTERAGFEGELNNAKFACEQAFRDWLRAADLKEWQP